LSGTSSRAAQLISCTPKRDSDPLEGDQRSWRDDPPRFRFRGLMRREYNEMRCSRMLTASSGLLIADYFCPARLEDQRKSGGC
jgi:hypothetical protein